MTLGKSEKVVDAYLKALEARDYELARTFLSDEEFRYVGPTGRFDDPDRFMEIVWPVGQILRRIERRKTFVDGPNVCNFMTFHVHIDEPKSVSVVQWAVVENGRIVAIETVFDASEYLGMFETETN
jgi:hypothetical protein